MLVLSTLALRRRSINCSRLLLARLANIAPTRLAELETRHAEPWFDEALGLARVFGCAVYDLCVAADLKSIDFDPRFFTVDLKFWGDGVRLPLSVALRLAHRFGVAPDDLNPSPLTQQLWAVLEASERHPEAPGWCSWCQADILGGAAHAPTCTPHNLLGIYNQRHGVVAAGTADAPRPTGRGSRRGSAKVPGLKALRERLGIKQAAMAEILDVNVNHYSRVERCELPLTLVRTEALCQRFNLPRDALFTAPDPVVSDDNSVPPAPPVPALVE